MRGTDTQGDALAVWLLALGQTIGFACLYYIFPAMLVTWEAALGWPKATLALGPTLAIVLSALLAPLAGRLVDAGWGAELLAGGPLVGAAGLVALSQITSPAAFVAVWALIGLAHAASLYEVCFAFLTRRLGSGARPAIIRVTLLGGLASTLAFPAGAILGAALGWRGATLAFALALVLLAAPAHYIAGRRLRRGQPPRRAPSAESRATDRASLHMALRRPGFWLLAALFALLWLNHGVLVAYFIPLFTERGASPAMAVAAAACVGPAQVVGRLLLMLNESRVSSRSAAHFATGAMVFAGAALLLAGAAPGLIFVFAVLQGAAIGLSSILRPVLIAEVLGRGAFGTIAGAIAIAPLMATAAAPYLGAQFLAGLGETGLMLATLTMAALALAAALALRLAARDGMAG